MQQATERKLLQVVLALSPSRCLARCLNRWQQEGDQDANDRNHDQQLDHRETTRAMLSASLPAKMWCAGLHVNRMLQVRTIHNDSAKRRKGSLITDNSCL